MANLSAYLDFSIILDYSLSTPQLKLVDTSNYPTGVAAGITGIISATQPDEVTVTGTFVTPDVTYSGGALTVGQKELRYATDGRPQNGSYSITYTVRHASYDETSRTKTFTLNYTPPKVIITDAFDVFTPYLRVTDSTTYTMEGWTFQSVIRSWTADIETIGTLLGSTQVFDLKYNGNYYDSTYNITLAAVAEWDSNDYTWLTLIDKLTGAKTVSAYIPKPLPDLLTAISEYKNAWDVANCNNELVRNDNYINATSLYTLLVERGRLNDLGGLEDYVTQIEKLVNDNITPTYENTNQVISPYDWETETGGDGEGGSIIEFSL